jgi:hypothetical protein
MKPMQIKNLIKEYTPELLIILGFQSISIGASILSNTSILGNSAVLFGASIVIIVTITLIKKSM